MTNRAWFWLVKLLLVLLSALIIIVSWLEVLRAP